MHYMIMKWEDEHWAIKHYSHDFDDMVRMMNEYPEDKGYIHLIDIKYIKSHGILERVEAIKAKAGLT